MLDRAALRAGGQGVPAEQADQDDAVVAAQEPVPAPSRDPSMTSPPPSAGTARWAPPLADLRLVGAGRGVLVLSPDASVSWWCAPDPDDAPLCWRLLDPGGGTARFPGLEPVEADVHHQLEDRRSGPPSGSRPHLHGAVMAGVLDRLHHS